MNRALEMCDIARNGPLHSGNPINRRGRERGRKRILEEVMAKTFPNLI